MTLNNSSAMLWQEVAWLQSELLKARASGESERARKFAKTLKKIRKAAVGVDRLIVDESERKTK